MRAVGVAQKVCPFDEVAVEMTGYFEERDGADRKFAVDADADAGFEMRVEIVFFRHRKRQRAVREMDVARDRVHLGRIALETALSGDGLCNRHRNHRRNITFAGRDDALRIEAGQGEAAGILQRGQQVEAAERQTAELLFGNYLFQGTIDAVCTRERRADFVFDAFAAGNLLEFGNIALADRFIRFHQPVHRNVDNLDPQLVADDFAVAAAGDQPVGRETDDAETQAVEILESVDRLFEDGDAGVDVFVAAVQNLTAEPLPVQIAQNLERGRERIALAGGQQIEGTVLAQVRQQALEDAFGAARADVDQIEPAGPVGGEVVAAEGVADVQAGEEVAGLEINGIAIVQGRGQGIDRNHTLLVLGTTKIRKFCYLCRL